MPAFSAMVQWDTLPPSSISISWLQVKDDKLSPIYDILNDIMWCVCVCVFLQNLGEREDSLWQCSGVQCGRHGL